MLVTARGFVSYEKSWSGHRLVEIINGAEVGLDCDDGRTPKFCTTSRCRPGETVTVRFCPDDQFCRVLSDDEVALERAAELLDAAGRGDAAREARDLAAQVEG